MVPGVNQTSTGQPVADEDDMVIRCNNDYNGVTRCDQPDAFWIGQYYGRHGGVRDGMTGCFLDRAVIWEARET
jgi:hypothetical protein